MDYKNYYKQKLIENAYPLVTTGAAAGKRLMKNVAGLYSSAPEIINRLPNPLSTVSISREPVKIEPSQYSGAPTNRLPNPTTTGSISREPVKTEPSQYSDSPANRLPNPMTTGPISLQNPMWAKKAIDRLMDVTDDIGALGRGMGGINPNARGPQEDLLRRRTERKNRFRVPGAPFEL